MMHGSSHRVEVRGKAEFLRAMMNELAGDTRISLEGDLSQWQFANELVLAREETEHLKRNTSSPRQDFAVLRLTAESVAPIFKQVMAAGLNRAIVHVKIQRNGVVELGAYDNFDPECVVTGPSVSETLLLQLRDAGIVRNFKAAHSAP
jgi:hypothetical protein